MSRCFPFPPPGYKNKSPINHLDLLAKEKYKEKKHKKEKKDKEKREGKDKKDKDRSKDKRKEKKDRKEKHKDKKKDKDKDRDQDKSRTPNEGRTEEHTTPQKGEKVGDSGHNADDVKDSKYVEELGRRIRNEEKGVANRVAENSSGFFQKRNESMGSGMAFSTPVQRSESVGTGTAVTASSQKRSETCSIPKGIETKGTGTASTNFLQKRAESVGTGSGISGLDKGRIGSTSTVTAIGGSVEKRIESVDARTAINDSVQKRMETADTGSAINSSLPKRIEKMGTGSGQKRNESKGTAMGADKERGSGNKMVANHIIAEERRNNGMGKLVEMDMDKRIESVGATTVKNERVAGNKMVPNHVGKEERRNSGLGKQEATDADKRTGAKDKDKDREADRHRDKDREEKRNKGKHKDKDKYKEKEKDKMRQKGEQREKAQEIIKDSGKKDLVDSSSIKPSAFHIDSEKCTHTDGSIKKRKDFEVNGMLHENDVRPNKLLKTTPSPLPTVQNGRTLELSHMSTPNSLIRHDASNSVKAGLPDNKTRKANGITGAHTPPIEMKPLAIADTSGNGEITKKPPHRDCKYLNQVYSVPKMEEFSENVDQAWLFSSENYLQKPMKLKAEETPQVWAEAMHIDSADVFALPYVIPY
ncbi:hypothetical protein J5N97_007271 [Dioscorea zingiberensis]|uniref:Myb-like protein X n=1 Tax=Dioscorea zingiberensis TaxID=325984 RepID=A0A9D5DDL2_9LILI|nr:hypothetical protein J5N97_007271 [Dioscorea zingiberensis]